MGGDEPSGSEALLQLGEACEPAVLAGLACHLWKWCLKERRLRWAPLS